MSNSFIKFKRNGFWIYDGTLSITVSYIYQYLCSKNKKDNWEKKFLIDLEFCAGMYMPGCLDMKLGKHLNSNSKIDVFLNDLNKLISKFDEKPQLIDIEELNQIQVDVESNKWNVSLDKSKIIKALYFIKQLVEGKLDIKIGDKVDYW